MRIVFFGNNELGLNALRFLKNRKANLVGIVLNGRKKQRLADKIRRLAPHSAKIFTGPFPKESSKLKQLKALRADLGICVGYGHILDPSTIAIFPKGIINLHIGFLPFNRGAHPNFWSIVEGTKSGVTLHMVDPGIDTGPIVAQSTISVGKFDTGKTLYEKLSRGAIQLLRKKWKRLSSGQFKIRAQRSKGTFHQVSDLPRGQKIAFEKRYSGRELFDLLRASSFPPHPGAYFEVDGKKIPVNLILDSGE